MNITKSEKIGNTLKVTALTQRSEESFHTIETLTKQRADILRQKAADDLKRDAEIADIDQILAECLSRGVTAESIEP